MQFDTQVDRTSNAPTISFQLSTPKVVPGAASEIGRALAVRFVAEGITVVLADAEVDALVQAEAELRH
jgi:NADP-dependent 3-hydroxy acid dehydrogenase YdfG